MLILLGIEKVYSVLQTNGYLFSFPDLIPRSTMYSQLTALCVYTHRCTRTGSLLPAWLTTSTTVGLCHHAMVQVRKIVNESKFDNGLSTKQTYSFILLYRHTYLHTGFALCRLSTLSLPV